VGRKVTSLDLSHSDHIRDIRGRRENHISFGMAEETRGNDLHYGTENKIPCSRCKPDVGILTRGREDSEVHVRRLSPVRESTKTREVSQQGHSNKVESERDDGATMGLKYCPNSGTIKSLQASFGELCRIGTMGNIMRPNELCHLVLPHPNPAQEIGRTFGDQESMSIMSKCGENDDEQQGCNNSLMVVDTFASEQVRRRVALNFGYDLPFHGRDPKEFFESTDYIECVAEFGFNHIIVIGEIDYGMIFMDCYGRLFHWEDECQKLFPYESEDGLPWFVDDDGNVYKLDFI